MDYYQSAVDILRAFHLVFFAAGMGTAAFFDFQQLRSLNVPLTQQSLHDLTKLHIWISSAFFGLWVSGIALIYVRTSFEIAQFSPKLWLKLVIMSAMVLISASVGKTVIPLLRKNIGSPLISIRKIELLLIAQIGILSMFCWTTGLLLGSSVTLKTASWDVLLPLSVGWLVFLTIIGQVVLLVSTRRRDISFDATERG